MNASTILESLRKHSESQSIESGRAWGMVYLDNARPSTISRHQFAGFLSALEGQGLYRKTSDPMFGEVVLAVEAAV